MDRKKKKPLTLVKEVLLASYEVGATIYDIFQYPSVKYNRDVKINKQVIRNTVSRLKKEGYIKEVEIKGRKKYIATLKGKIKILAYLKKDKKWDGKWRIVVFDVPEKKKKMRNFFRQKLNELGFRQLQKSVWICPYNIADTVEELIELCQAKPYVHYLLVEELDNKNLLMKLFKLSG